MQILLFSIVFLRRNDIISVYNDGGKVENAGDNNNDQNRNNSQRF